MELSRRDALVALASTGVAVGAGAASILDREPEGEDTSESGTSGSEEHVSTADRDAVLTALTAAAVVVYPTAVSNVDEFVTTYASGKLDARPAYRESVGATVADLDSYVAVYTEAERFADLDTSHRETVLERMGVDTADPDPDGTVTGRVRYYVVNDLLFALYSSPTGGELVGIENPQGHPGGRTHSRRPE